MCMKTQIREHTHTHTSLPLLPSCEGFDIRLPAADAAAAAANANAAQSLKQQWKTATNMTQRRVKLHTAEELPLVRKQENTHSSVSPGILSLSRWAFMAELCLFALLWSWYAFTLPALLPPPLHWQRAKPSRHSAMRQTRFLSLHKKGGGKKGGLWFLFWSFHVPPWSCQMRPLVACGGHGGRTILLIPSPNTRPLLLHKHMHISIPLPP